jgi:hypothetical protein
MIHGPPLKEKVALWRQCAPSACLWLWSEVAQFCVRRHPDAAMLSMPHQGSRLMLEGVDSGHGTRQWCGELKEEWCDDQWRTTEGG